MRSYDPEVNSSIDVSLSEYLKVSVDASDSLLVLVPDSAQDDNIAPSKAWEGRMRCNQQL